MTRVAGLAIGLVFGVTLSWTGMVNPAVIRRALLFESSYLYFFFGSAVLTATIGLQLVKRFQTRALLTDSVIGWTPETPQRRHVVGALIFGIGWGVSGACPGPIAAQIGQGVPWAIFIMLGVIGGVYLFLRRQQPETEPASDRAPARAAAESGLTTSCGQSQRAAR